MEKPYIELINSKYDDCVILDEYNGQISLVSGNTGKDGGVYMRWCFPQTKDRKASGKSIPWKITIGEGKDEAIETLEYFIAVLQNKATESLPEAQDGPPDYPSDEDIPF